MVVHTGDDKQGQLIELYSHSLINACLIMLQVWFSF